MPVVTPRSHRGALARQVHLYCTIPTLCLSCAFHKHHFEFTGMLQVPQQLEIDTFKIHCTNPNVCSSLLGALSHMYQHYHGHTPNEWFFCSSSHSSHLEKLKSGQTILLFSTSRLLENTVPHSPAIDPLN